jgi:hypothetical protein
MHNQKRIGGNALLQAPSELLRSMAYPFRPSLQCFPSSAADALSAMLRLLRTERLAGFILTMIMGMAKFVACSVPDAIVRWDGMRTTTDKSQFIWLTR